MRNTSKNIFWDVSLDPYLFGIVGYLSIIKKILNAEWNLVEIRFVSKLGCWQIKLLSYGDRLVLINLVLTSLPMFMLSFVEIPKGVRKCLVFFCSRFFWQSHDTKKKYMLTKWNIICCPKDPRDLGVEVLEL
jgi:hypothetical protein